MDQPISPIDAFRTCILNPLTALVNTAKNDGASKPKRALAVVSLAAITIVALSNLPLIAVIAALTAVYNVVADRFNFHPISDLVHKANKEASLVKKVALYAAVALAGLAVGAVVSMALPLLLPCAAIGGIVYGIYRARTQKNLESDDD